MITKKEAIQQTALKLFTEKGFHNTPTSLIAKEAGVATGTLFHHFKSKEELLNYLYLDVKLEMKNAIESKVDGCLDFDEKLAIFWVESVRWALDNPLKSQFLNSVRTSIDLTSDTIKAAMESFCFASDLFIEGIEKGIIKNLPLEIIFEFIGSLYLASVSYFIQHRNKFDDAKSRDEIYSIVRDSLRVF